MSSKGFDKYVWLGLGIFLVGATYAASTNLSAIAKEASKIDATRQERKAAKRLVEHRKTRESPEDELSLDVLTTLANCPNYDIREAATKIIATRFASSQWCLQEAYYEYEAAGSQRERSLEVLEMLEQYGLLDPGRLLESFRRRNDHGRHMREEDDRQRQACLPIRWTGPDEVPDQAWMEAHYRTSSRGEVSVAPSLRTQRVRRATRSEERQRGHRAERRGSDLMRETEGLLDGTLRSGRDASPAFPAEEFVNLTRSLQDIVDTYTADAEAEAAEEQATDAYAESAVRIEAAPETMELFEGRASRGV